MVARAAALATVLPEGAVFSHGTAAVLHGAPVAARIEYGPVHVTVERPNRASRRAGVVWHETREPIAAVVVGGLGVTSPVDAFCQLGSEISLGDLVAVGDFLVTGDEPISGAPPLIGVDELRRAVDLRGSVRGIRTLRRAVELVRWGPLSRPESLLRVGLVLAGHPEPAINFSVFLPSTGRWIMVDLAYPEMKLAFEYEGDYHRTDRAKFEDDILRRERLSALGWTVIRVTAHDLTSAGWPGFLARVQLHVLRAGGIRR
ncbi:hypothetical protein ASF62_09930 [Leifsonia sp. Leaf325]|nr:hypothetical protein [Leifsonia sp. Leaf325]KQQ94419.1 hypothetical protein ASF62_09930 [Leifsonia sp. Leaf325]